MKFIWSSYSLSLQIKESLFRILLSQIMISRFVIRIIVFATLLTPRNIQTEDMIEQLASLLLPIDALLAHPNFDPQINASPAIVALFRNMWFLCVLFHFTSGEAKDDTAMSWQKPALARIAAKTPPVVLEEAHDSIASDLEYNSVIRQEYAHLVRIIVSSISTRANLFRCQVISKHRTSLTKHITLRTSEIRSLSSGQIVFLLTMHDVESMKSAAGLPSSLLSYFTNVSLNKNTGLSSCMESVAEKVGQVYKPRFQLSL